MAAAVQQSRTKNSLRNTLFAAIAFVTKMLVQFSVRAVFIRYFIPEYLGVNGLFNNILTVLSLAELGVGNAIVYTMYKPVADNDIEKIKSLVRLYRNMYLIFAGVILTVGLALIPALPYLIKDYGATNIGVNLEVIYVIFLAQTVGGYFFAYRRALVFAYQRNDIESKVSFAAQVVLAVAQILIIILWNNFYAYCVALFVCTTLDAFIVFLISYKLFPDIKGKPQKLDKEVTKEIAKNSSAMLCHKISGAVVFSTDSIMISAFIGSSVLGYYSNYTLVTAGLTSIVSLVVTAVKGSIGNYISTKTPEEAFRLYNSLNQGIMWLVGFLAIGAVVCFQDFILIYADNSEYVLGFSTMLLICISFFVNQSRQITAAFKECAGLFWNDRFRPLLESGINLGLDFLLVRFLGINGIILATIISMVTTAIWWEPLVLYKHYFKKPMKSFFAHYISYTVVIVFVCAISYFACYFMPHGGIGWLIFRFVDAIILPNALFYIIFSRTKEFRYLIDVVKSILGRKSKPQAAVESGAETVTEGDASIVDTPADLTE